MRIKHLLDVRFPDRPDLLRHNLATLENQQPGIAANLVTAGRLDVGSHIYFANLHPARILGRNFIDRRTHLPARGAALGPEVNQNWLRGFQNRLLETSVCKNQCICARHVLILFGVCWDRCLNGWDRCIHMSIEHLFDVRFAHRPDFLVHNFPTLENQQCGDAANLVTASRLNVRVHVDLADLHSAGILCRDLIDRRTHLPAGATPLGPEVNQNRLSGFQNFLIESTIRKNQRVRTRHVLSPINSMF
jgi:hypothetical protein